MEEKIIKKVKVKYMGKPCLCKSEFYFGKLTKDTELDIAESLYKSELAGHKDWELLKQTKTKKKGEENDG